MYNMTCHGLKMYTKVLLRSLDRLVSVYKGSESVFLVSFLRKKCDIDVTRSSREFCIEKNINNAAGKLAHNQKPDWNKAVSEAEEIVGYSTSVLTWLLSDDIANVALHLRKLDGSNHPLLDTANQRALAEVTQMIRTYHLVHKSMVNIYPGMYPEASILNNMIFGNKIALLSGDYILANVSGILANMRNHEILDLIGHSLRDLAEGEFIGRRDQQNNPLPSPQGVRDAAQDWTHRNVLSAGNLLGRACQGTLKLAGHGRELQEQGYNFGKHLILAWQACVDLEPFIPGSQYVSGSLFNLTSAPVLFHLQHDPSLFNEIDKGLNSIQNVDFEKIHSIVSKGPGIFLTKQLQKNHSQKVMEVLQVFQESDARTAIRNIIMAMSHY
ncbi:all trans-polyprenyl-diphosphate synthase PDSS2-like isoform X2 [Periplaneta americana]|uniref:all trans-polyprenyl-diphosphate synthase PDSS2-like isoform X2 n=1 Tax=Periplaneta americana TaxID=6978 RepID=UPI0037E88878